MRNDVWPFPHPRVNNLSPRGGRLGAITAYVCDMRCTQLLPLFFIAPVWAQCDLEIYGYNPINTEITIVVNDGYCLTDADSIGEFLLGMTFDPPLIPSPFPCVQNGDWAKLVFPLDFPGFTIGEGADNILQSGDTITFLIDEVPLFGSGTADCWIEAIQTGAFYDECVVLAIFQINDSDSILGDSGIAGEAYPDDDINNNIIVWSLGPNCDAPPPPYDDKVFTSNPCDQETWFVPNAFTPNNDGKNDVFKAVTNSDCWLWFEMEVYNRWGNLVWRTTTPGDPWYGNNTVSPWNKANSYDGRYFVPDGVYNWRVRGQRYGDGDVWLEQRGTITLMR